MISGLSPSLNAGSEPPALGPVVLVSDREASVRWLRGVVGTTASFKPCPADPERLAERLGEERPAVVVIDFSDPAQGPAAELAQRAAQAVPAAALLAMGRAAEPGVALAALRAGARDFLDTESPAADALGVLHKHGRPGAAVRAVRGRVVSVIGARAGVGSSTLAVHLAVMVEEALKAEDRTAALLDLGIPVGDSQVLLETRGSFSFAEAARSQHRIDATFVQSALPRHASGLAVLSLPSNVAELRELSHAAAVGVTQRLRGHVDVQVIDLGGFANQEFIAQVAAVSEHCLLVCDQSAPSVISAIELSRTLRGRGLRPRLVVSKADEAVDPTPAQMAARLELPLAGVLPQRSTALLQALNTGRLLHQVAPSDPYVKAVRQLMASVLHAGAAEGGGGGEPSPGLGQRVKGLLGGWRKPGRA